MVNSDVVDLSLVYVSIVKQNFKASGYKIWDDKNKDRQAKKKYTFILNLL